MYSPTLTEILDSKDTIAKQLKALKKYKDRPDVIEYIDFQMHRNDDYSPWIEDNINKYFYGLPIKRVRTTASVREYKPRLG